MLAATRFRSTAGDHPVLRWQGRSMSCLSLIQPMLSQGADPHRQANPPESSRLAVPRPVKPPCDRRVCARQCFRICSGQDSSSGMEVQQAAASRSPFVQIGIAGDLATATRHGGAALRPPAGSDRCDARTTACSTIYNKDSLLNCPSRNRERPALGGYRRNSRSKPQDRLRSPVNGGGRGERFGAVLRSTARGGLLVRTPRIATDTWLGRTGTTVTSSEEDRCSARGPAGRHPRPGSSVGAAKGASGVIATSPARPTASGRLRATRR